MSCGIFGVFGHPEASRLVYLGLYALQHRGQESAGIVSISNGKFYSFRSMGLVAEIFTEDIIKNLKGDVAIGHVRYSTTGVSSERNAQPFLVESPEGAIAIAHNGNLTNTFCLRKKLREKGCLFQSTTDTELIAHLFALSKEGGIKNRIISALSQIEGAYSLLFLSKGGVIATRDPFGFRPLVLGQFDDAYVVSSETCALDLVGAKFLREILPGELLTIDRGGLNSIILEEKKEKKFCVFEIIYFSRPDSFYGGKSVYNLRCELGRRLAREAFVEADIVVPVPDSGLPCAIGYSKESCIPFVMAIIRNHYIGRTFIQPSQYIRDFGVKIKLNPVKDFINGKRVIIIDDSIVRGTTVPKIVKMLRECDAKEIHVRIGSPPTRFPCFYGIDTPTKEELLAAKFDTTKIKKLIGADTLEYLSLFELRRFEEAQGGNFCDACFSGEYPVPPPPRCPPDCEIISFG